MGEDLPGAVRELKELLAPFYVLTSKEDWNTLDHLWEQLDEEQRIRLRHEVNELLFLWIAGVETALDRAVQSPSATRLASDPQVLRQALDVCDRAITFAEPNGPWRALRAMLADHGEEAGQEEQASTADPPRPAANRRPTRKTAERAFKRAMNDRCGDGLAQVCAGNFVADCRIKDARRRYCIGSYHEVGAHLRDCLTNAVVGRKGRVVVYSDSCHD